MKASNATNSKKAEEKVLKAEREYKKSFLLEKSNEVIHTVDRYVVRISTFNSHSEV